MVTLDSGLIYKEYCCATLEPVEYCLSAHRLLGVGQKLRSRAPANGNLLRTRQVTKADRQYSLLSVASFRVGSDLDRRVLCTLRLHRHLPNGVQPSPETPLNPSTLEIMRAFHVRAASGMRSTFPPFLLNCLDTLAAAGVRGCQSIIRCPLKVFQDQVKSKIITAYC